MKTIIVIAAICLFVLLLIDLLIAIAFTEDSPE